MITFLLVIHLVACIALIAIILLQAGKGAGLSNMFGGGSSGLFAPSSDTFLTKFTALLAAMFLFTSIFLSLKLSDKWSSSLRQKIMDTKEESVPASTEE